MNRASKDLIIKERDSLISSINQDIWEYLYLKTGQLPDEKAGEEAENISELVKQMLKTTEAVTEYTEAINKLKTL